MPGEDKQTTEQSQSSTTSPWSAAQPMLKGLIDKFSGLNTDVTGGQKSALDTLTSATSNLPNFGAQGAGAVGNFFNMSTTPQVGMLSDAFSKLQGNLGATASGAELDPYSTPGFGDAINTMSKDITNRVKGTYAGSGRDPSGAGSFAGTLGRGLTEGISPVIAAQFNQNKSNQMGAANTLFNAGGSTASGMTAQQMAQLGAGATGLGLIPQLMSAYTAPGQAQLGAANASYAQPFANLMQLLQPSAALGAMGSQSSGTGTSTTTQPQNTMSNIMGGLSGGIGLLSLMSDERAKDDIERVGRLDDGQPIFRYHYKGSDVPQIGLLAQRVRNVAPEAVEEVGGMLRVNYGKATDRAAEIARAA